MLRVDRLELDYLITGMVTYPPGATFGPRVLTDFELVWIVAGDAIYHLSGVEHRAPAGSIVLAQPGFDEAYTWDAKRSTRHMFFHTRFKRVPGDWPEIARWPVVSIMPENDIVRPLFRYVLACGRRGSNGVGNHQSLTPMLVRAVEMLIGALVVGPLAQASELDHQSHPAVQAAMLFMREAMEEDPGQRIRLAQIARAAAVSPEHLCRLFTQSLGVAPMEALMLLRLDMATALMSRSNLTLSQIADRCGFSSAYHLSRRFSAAFGKPPSKVREMVRKGEAPPVSRLLR
jgi:AraC family transcriptional regulator